MASSFIKEWNEQLHEINKIWFLVDLVLTWFGWTDEELDETARAEALKESYKILNHLTTFTGRPEEGIKKKNSSKSNSQIFLRPNICLPLNRQMGS